VSAQVFVVIASLAAYMMVIVVIGLYSARLSRWTMEDYHMGSREFRVFVLFSAVFGANISAVALIGVPGSAYHLGWIMWPYFVTAWAWLTPLLFYVIGSRSWVLGRKLGYMTVGEVIGNRWRSPGLAVLISAVLIVYTVPYLMTGLLAGGRILEALTDGFFPLWIGEVVVALVVVVYLLLGGMRGAAWVNTFQTSIFMIGGVAIFLMLASALGGPGQATQRVMADYPELITRSNMPWKQFFSYGVIVGLCPVLFPQVFMRLLTGRNPKALKQMMVIYPVPALFVVFLTAMVGMWGHAAIPGLDGAESDAILPLLLVQYTPIWMMGILGAAVFAAIMSTMDSQLLSVTTMITRDLLSRTEAASSSEREMVRISRGLVIVLTIGAFVLAYFNPLGIIRIVEFAFAGFACLLAPTIGALYWKRCTKQAAAWSIVVSELLLIALTFGWLPAELAFGFLPGLPAIVVGLLTLVVVTYLTPAPEDEGTREYFSLFDDHDQSGAR